IVTPRQLRRIQASSETRPDLRSEIRSAVPIAGLRTGRCDHLDIVDLELWRIRCRSGGRLSRAGRLLRCASDLNLVAQVRSQLRVIRIETILAQRRCAP